jgi:hypothetical protein
VDIALLFNYVIVHFKCFLQYLIFLVKTWNIQNLLLRSNSMQLDKIIMLYNKKKKKKQPAYSFFFSNAIKKILIFAFLIKFQLGFSSSSVFMCVFFVLCTYLFEFADSHQEFLRICHWLGYSLVKFKKLYR